MSNPEALTFVELRSFSQLDELSDSTLESMANILLPMFFEKNTTFHHFGNQEIYLFFIKAGRVSVHTQIEDTEEKIAELEQFQIFGLKSLFQQSSRNLSYKTMEDTLLYALPKQLHQWAMERGTVWAIELQRYATIELTHTMRHAIEEIRTRSTQKSNARNALFELLCTTEFSIPLENEDDDSE